MSRPRVLTLIAGLAGVLALAAVLVLTPQSNARPAPDPDLIAAEQTASRACFGAAYAQEEVRQHAAPSVVLQWLGRATDNAREAFWLDSRWGSLHTGLEVLHDALSGPDGTEASKGLDLVRQSCPGL